MHHQLLPEPPKNLKGHFLLASPLLQETLFEQSCILITQSSQEHGHEGFILNHKTDLTVSKVLHHTEGTPVADIPLYLGGPVDTDSVNFLILRKSPSGKFLFRTNASIEQCEIALAEHDAYIIPCLGYSGWTAGQLENEFEHLSWFHAPARANLLDEPFTLALWTSMMQQQGAYHELIARSPGNPMKN